MGDSGEVGKKVFSKSRPYQHLAPPTYIAAVNGLGIPPFLKYSDLPNPAGTKRAQRPHFPRNFFPDWGTRQKGGKTRSYPRTPMEASGGRQGKNKFPPPIRGRHMGRSDRKQRTFLRGEPKQYRCITSGRTGSAVPGVQNFRELEIPRLTCQKVYGQVAVG